MPAKAMVPVDTLPCIDRFRGHGPLLQFVVMHRGGDIQEALPLFVRHAGTRSGPTGPRGGHGQLLQFVLHQNAAAAAT